MVGVVFIYLDYLREAGPHEEYHSVPLRVAVPKAGPRMETFPGLRTRSDVDRAQPLQNMPSRLLPERAASRGAAPL